MDLFPAYGSVVDHLAPNTNGLPTFVSYPHTIADGSVTQIIVGIVFCVGSIWDTYVDERTLREIYLAAFEPAVRGIDPTRPILLAVASPLLVRAHL